MAKLHYKYTYPIGNCKVFKFQPFLLRASDNRYILKTFDPIATTDVVGFPKMKIPFIFRNL